MEGSFSCVCEAGFAKPTEDSDCADIDECNQDENTCSGLFEICINEAGSFECPCETGYHRIPEAAHCSDVNECENTCEGVLDVCQNTDGSFTCDCKMGYERDQYNECQDIDECNNGDNNCSTAANAYCTNIEGSFECGKVSS